MSTSTNRFSNYLRYSARSLLRLHGWFLLIACLVAEFALCLGAGEFQQLSLEQKNALLVPVMAGGVLTQMILFSLEGLAAILLIQSGQPQEKTPGRR
jgi:hypothetical protein